LEGDRFMPPRIQVMPEQLANQIAAGEAAGKDRNECRAERAACDGEQVASQVLVELEGEHGGDRHQRPHGQGRMGAGPFHKAVEFNKRSEGDGEHEQHEPGEAEPDDHYEKWNPYQAG